MVLRGAAVAKSLTKLGLQDNQFMEEDKVLDAIDFCMKKNVGLGKYNFKYNFISDHGVEHICTTLGEANHVFEVEIPERISKATMELFQEAKAANKPKKGKGGKGGKKKKK
jgi:Ran GTPase-activating protein (RanGAP) involved in mRNA processing and transport